MGNVRELVFSYRQSGARSVAKNDRRVRESIQRTGRVAERESGKVERWLDRNKKAMTAISVATLAAVGGILSAAPSFRAAMSGMRASFTLLAQTIVSDVLPSGTNLGSVALDLVNRFRDLDESIRRPISALVLVGGAIIGLLPVIAAFIKSAVAVGGALGSVVSVLSGVVAAVKTAVVVIATITGAAVSTVAAIGILIAAIGALAVAFITDFRGIRTKSLAALTSLYEGGRDRLLDLLATGRQLATQFRDAVVTKTLDARDRVLALLDIARDLSRTGREWVAGLARGVYDRVSRLVGAFRSMASQAARAFRDEFNRIIPSRISIPRVSIDIPDILGGGSVGVGGGSLRLPQLNTGGRIASDGLAMLHAGERVVPAAQVRERGSQPVGGDTVSVDTVNIMVQGSGDGRIDGRNIAREFERKLSDRGV